MKKGLQLIAVTLCIVGSAWAQNLKLINFKTSYDASAQKYTSKATVKNTTASSISIKVVRVVNNIVSGQNSYFCTGTSCYPPTQGTSAPYTIAAGALDTSLIGYLETSGISGKANVCYAFENANNPSDSASVCFTYNVTTGINDIANVETPLLQSPYPSPANTYSIIKYNIPSGKQGMLNIYNTLGALAYKTAVDEKQNEYVIPTLLLSDGMYFCTLQVDGKPISTKKLIVDHRN